MNRLWGVRVVWLGFFVCDGVGPARGNFGAEREMDRGAAETREG